MKKHELIEFKIIFVEPYDKKEKLFISELRDDLSARGRGFRRIKFIEDDLLVKKNFSAKLRRFRETFQDRKLR